MSDILIRGMEMPKDEPISIKIYPDGGVFVQNTPYGGWKAIPVPDHGRLGDLDALYEVVKRRTKNWAGGWSNIECALTGNDILKAETVIPASK